MRWPESSALLFKSRAPMTNGWMDHRAEARAWGAESETSRLFWTNYCQRARKHLLPASYFVPHKRRFIMAIVKIFDAVL